MDLARYRRRCGQRLPVKIDLRSILGNDEYCLGWIDLVSTDIYTEKGTPHLFRDDGRQSGTFNLGQQPAGLEASVSNQGRSLPGSWNVEMNYQAIQA